jgi:DNA-3-methyladenine glycosylase I
MKPMERCGWAEGDPLLTTYHDTEWGVPLHDDCKLFEYLLLDSMQAGLSWLVILRKREGFRRAFDGFDPARVAEYGPPEIERLLADPGIVRNRRKVEAVIGNARRFLEVQREFGTFDRYIWQFTGGGTIVNAHARMEQVPARSPESDAMSRDLARRGFKFAGSTICYAFMQAAGMVNDHLTACFRYRAVLGEDA